MLFRRPRTDDISHQSVSWINRLLCHDRIPPTGVILAHHRTTLPTVAKNNEDRLTASPIDAVSSESLDAHVPTEPTAGFYLCFSSDNVGFLASNFPGRFDA
jgi:hypothetical protein